MTSHPSYLSGEIVAAGIVFGTVIDKLPAIAAGLAALWYCILLYDRFRKK